MRENKNVEIDEFKYFHRLTYNLGRIHAIFLFLIYLPQDPIHIPVISALHKYYVVWDTNYAIFIYFILGAYLRHFYIYDKTLKNNKLYLKNYFAMLLAVSLSFWEAAIEIPNYFSNSIVRGFFELLLFVGFLFFLPLTFTFESTIIIPFFIGYLTVHRIIKPQRMESEGIFEPEIRDEKEDKENWEFVISGNNES